MSEPFQSHSQAWQDLWVYETLVRTEQLFTGTFLDIGCLCEGNDDLLTINNTYALEQLGWRGLLVDVQPSTSAPTTRKSPFVCADATTLNWNAALIAAVIPGFDGVTIDYLSLDVDEHTLAALRNLLNHGVRFRRATIEHDVYQRGEGVRNAIRELMWANGYTLARADVAVVGRGGLVYPFEDWWVDEKTVAAVGRPPVTETEENGRARPSAATERAP